MNDNIFRSYDIRGKYPRDINEDIAYKIGLGYGSILQEKYKQTTCCVSMDNRLSSPNLHDSLIKGLLESGVNVIDYGLTTTPMNYYCRYINNVFGIIVTASHNPKDENGFKFSFDKYSNARGSMISEFRDYIKAGVFLKGTGTYIKKDIKNEYINHLVNNLRISNKLLKVVFDPANGVVTSILEDILKRVNIEYIIINKESDGNFPNHPADPSIEENLSMLKRSVIENKADLGIGFDGDGDRIGIIDNLGNLVPIEIYGILMAKDMYYEVDNKTFMYDAKCSNIFKDELNKINAKSVICRTGSSYTEEMIHKDNLPFGIQYVGHIGINDRFYSIESAIYASLRLVEILSHTDKSLNELVSSYPKYYNIEEMRINSTDDKKRIVIDNIRKYCLSKNFYIREIDGLRVEFSNGWAYVRASNTGPTINLRCEAKSKEDLDNITNIFIELINRLN